MQPKDISTLITGAEKAQGMAKEINYLLLEDFFKLVDSFNEFVAMSHCLT